MIVCICCTEECILLFLRRCLLPVEGEEDRCLHVALPVAAFPEMLTKSVITRASTGTRAECAQRAMGQTTPFSGRSSRNAAEDDPQPNILQMNTEGLTENKIFVIEQLQEQGFIRTRLSSSSYRRPTAQLQTS